MKSTESSANHRGSKRRRDMPKQIYELAWVIGCSEFEFLKTEWKVFDSELEAKAYGLREQDELNGGLPPDEKSWDGYYYRLYYARPVDEVDGFRILLAERR